NIGPSVFQDFLRDSGDHARYLIFTRAGSNLFKPRTPGPITISSTKLSTNARRHSWLPLSYMALSSSGSRGTFVKNLWPDAALTLISTRRWVSSLLLVLR